MDLKVLNNSTWGNDEEEKNNDCLWMVTFADAMSLLLTFFVLLISFSSFDTVNVNTSLNSVSEHLGGGAKKGEKIIKANQNLAQELDELLDKRKNVVLSELNMPLPVKPININVNDFQKTRAIKELLRKNPALIRMLINKKSPPGIKINKYEHSFSKVNPEDFQAVDLELSLQNLEYFIISEGLEKVFKIDVKDNGEISFEIDCIAVFKKGTDEINEDSKKLLKRIGNIIKKVPNKIALESFGEDIFDSFFRDNQKADLAMRRNLMLLRYFVSFSKDIEEERFSLLIRGNMSDKIDKIKEYSKKKEGIIVITILAFSESMY